MIPWCTQHDQSDHIHLTQYMIFNPQVIVCVWRSFGPHARREGGSAGTMETGAPHFAAGRLPEEHDFYGWSQRAASTEDSAQDSRLNAASTSWRRRPTAPPSGCSIPVHGCKSHYIGIGIDITSVRHHLNWGGDMHGEEHVVTKWWLLAD